MKTFVVGDIHGALKGLKQLIAMPGKACSTERWVFLGDYVDRWPDSARVIDYLIELSSYHTCIFIKGNHDSWCQDWLSGKEASPVWLRNGGAATVASYKKYDFTQKGRHLQFFRNMKNYFVDEYNRLYIHAGFTAMKGPGHELQESYYYNDRTLVETALCLDKGRSKEDIFYPKRLRLFREIFVGHTPTLNYGYTVPVQAANVWMVDTGAGKGGRISVLEADTKNFRQSDKISSLYANEV